MISREILVEGAPFWFICPQSEVVRSSHLVDDSDRHTRGLALLKDRLREPPHIILETRRAKRGLRAGDAGNRDKNQCNPGAIQLIASKLPF
jgi:hypothetical protein